MRRLVLDASAAIELALETENARWFLSHLTTASVVSAPDFFCLEVANGLARYVLAETFGQEDAIELYEMASSFPDILFPSQELALESMVEGTAHDHSVYDLAYAVLARRTGAAVLTADLAFARLLERIEIPVLTP